MNAKQSIHCDGVNQSQFMKPDILLRMACIWVGSLGVSLCMEGKPFMDGKISMQGENLYGGEIPHGGENLYGGEICYGGEKSLWRGSPLDGDRWRYPPC